MMTEDLITLRDSVSRVLDSKCDHAAVHAFIDGPSRLEELTWSNAAELGWLGIAIPEEYGGLGLGLPGLDVIHRELGRHLSPGPFIATLAGAQWLLEAARVEQQAEFLPRIAVGELTVAVPASLQSVPLELLGRQVNGQINVLGALTSGIVIAPVGMQDVITGWAIMACDGSSVRLTPQQTWDRTRQICRLSCAAAEAVVIQDPQGTHARSLGRHLALAVASDSIGAAAGVVAQVIEHLKSRVQFGRPIGAFQALKHRAADLVALVATHQHLIDQAVEVSALARFDADMWAALAKAGASEACAFITGDCIQLFGGVGHTWEFDAHLYAKRARLNEALGASNATQRDFAAAELLAAERSGRATTELGW